MGTEAPTGVYVGAQIRDDPSEPNQVLTNVHDGRRVSSFFMSIMAFGKVVPMIRCQLVHTSETN